MGLNSTSILVVISRAVYSFYWVYIAPVYLEVQMALGFSRQDIGLISWAFVVGAASFQIPSSMLSNYIGVKHEYYIGLFVLSASGLLFAASGSLFMILVSRVIAGIGAALFFSSAGHILAYASGNRVGAWMGIYNSAFSLGTVMGMAYSYTYQLIGWREAVALGSVFGSILAAVDALSIRHLDIPAEQVRLNRGVIAPLLLGVSTAGFWGANYAAQTLMPSYLERLGEGVITSSWTTSIMLAASAVGGFFAFVFDRTKRKRVLLMIVVLFTGLGLLLLYSSYTFIEGLLIEGFFSELVFSGLYAVAIDKTGKGLATVALSSVNFMNMAFGMWIPLIFSFEMFKFPGLVWATMFAVTVLPSIAVLWI